MFKIDYTNTNIHNNVTLIDIIDPEFISYENSTQ